MGDVGSSPTLSSIKLKDMLEKICFTVIFVLVLLFSGSWILMNVDEEREDMWYKITLTTSMLEMMFIFGGMIASIWLN